MEKENYEQRIDILKAFGTILIIIAHTISSIFINQLRVFDVPLLIIVSGILSVDSYKREKSYFSYLKKRIIRLVIPTYLFFTIFFLGTFIVSKALNIDFPFTNIQVRNTYLLLDGVGYVWIIRVYLLTAIITPILLKFKDKFKIPIQIILLLVIYVLYELLFWKVRQFKYNTNICYLLYYSLLDFNLVRN